MTAPPHPRWTLRDCIEHRCTSEEYVADLKLDVDERLKRDHEKRVARVTQATAVGWWHRFTSRRIYERSHL